MRWGKSPQRMSNEGVSSMGPRSSDGKKKRRMGGCGGASGTPDGDAADTAADSSEVDDVMRVPAADDANTADDPSDPGGLNADATAESEPAPDEQPEPDEPVYRGRFANLASPEAGWAVPGVTGLDAGSGYSGESGDSESDCAETVSAGDAGDGAGADGGAGADSGRFGVSRVSADPDRFLGCDAVALLEEFDELNARLATVVGCADAHACRRLVERLTPTVRKLEALVGQAAGKAAVGGGTDSCRHATPRVWLAYETRVTPTVAGSMLADQDFLGRQPEIAAARAAGELSWQHITAFRTVVTAKPWREAPFAQVVEHFVTVAQCSDPTELRKALTTWAEALDDEVAPDRPDRAYADRALHLRQVGEIWDIRGTLPKVEGATLAGVLDEVIAAARRAGCTCGQNPCTCPDDSTPRATKRADALTALAGWATAHRTCLTDDPLLSAGGAQRSRPMIIVPLDRLAPHQIPTSLREQLNAIPVGHGGRDISDSQPAAGRDPHDPSAVAPPGAAGGTVRLTARELNEGLTHLGASAVRWYAGSESGTLNRRDTEVELCDATVARIITDPDGYPLDVGHETRLINPGLRAALIARDGGCVVAGCTIPASWSDAHHVIPWSAGGDTSLQNLALACRRHHRAIHTGHWEITFINGIPNAHPS